MYWHLACKYDCDDATVIEINFIPYTHIFSMLFSSAEIFLKSENDIWNNVFNVVNSNHWPKNNYNCDLVCDEFARKLLDGNPGRIDFHRSLHDPDHDFYLCWYINDELHKSKHVYWTFIPRVIVDLIGMIKNHNHCSIKPAK